MDLGRRVRDLRTAQHLSQIELAARAGVARNTLNRIENGHLMPTAPVIEHLAEALNVGPGTLFEEPAAPLGGAPQESGRFEPGPAKPPVVHLSKLSDVSYEEVRANARTLDEKASLRSHIDTEYKQLRRWLRTLTHEQPTLETASADIEEARGLLEKARKRYEVAVFDEAEHTIAFDEQRTPRLSRTASKSVDEAFEELQAKAKQRTTS